MAKNVRSDNSLIDAYLYLLKNKYSVAFCDGHYVVGSLDANISGRFGVFKLGKEYPKHTIKLDSNIPASGEISVDENHVNIKSGRRKLTLTQLGDRLPRLELEEYCASLKKAKQITSVFQNAKEASRFEEIHFITHNDASYVAFASPHMVALVPDSLGINLRVGSSINAKDVGFIENFAAVDDELGVLVSGSSNKPEDGFNVIRFQDKQSRHDMLAKLLAEFASSKKQHLVSPLTELKEVSAKNYNTALTKDYIYLVEDGGKSQITIEYATPLKTEVFLNFEPFKLCLEFMYRHKTDAEKEEQELLFSGNDTCLFVKNRKGALFIMLKVREFAYEAAH